MAFEFKMSSREIVENLEKLGLTVKGNIIRNAMRAGAIVIRDEARKRVPIRTGSLKKAIGVKTAKTRPGSKNGPWIGIVRIEKVAFDRNEKGKYKKVDRRVGRGTKRYRRGDIYPRNYDHLVEFGTKPHKIGKRGGMHPGTPARPYMRAALFAKKAAALEAIRQHMMKNLFKGLVPAGRKAG